MAPEDERTRTVRAWLVRPKLWDDVFAGTLSNLISAAIIALVAGASGLIDLPPIAWGVSAGLLAGLTAGGLAFRWLEPFFNQDPFDDDASSFMVGRRWAAHERAAETVAMLVAAGVGYLAFRLAG